MNISKLYAFSIAVLISTTGYAQQWLGSTTDANAIYRSGNVGIGTTTTPESYLHLQGSSNYVTFRIQNTGPGPNYGSSGLNFYNAGTGSNGYRVWTNQFPAPGNGLHMESTGTFGSTGVHILGNTIRFGANMGYSSLQLAKYHFEGKAYMDTIKIGHSTSPYQLTNPGVVNILGNSNITGVSYHANDITFQNPYPVAFGSLGINFSGFGNYSMKATTGTGGSSGLYISNNSLSNRFICMNSAGFTGVNISSSPSYSLTNAFEVNGSVRIGTSTLGTNAAPTDGLLVEGNVAVGTACVPSGYKMAVKGKVICEELKVKLENSNCWADYVFDQHYKLRSLKEVESFVARNKHLPGIPSAKEVESNGVNLGEMDAKLLEKIEELTLYLIEMKKENEQMKMAIETMKAEFSNR